MKLTQPITFVDPQSQQSSQIDNIDIVVIDDNARKVVLAKLLPFAKTMMLWKGLEYDQIGDYTQEQVENRVLEIIAQNPHIGSF